MASSLRRCIGPGFGDGEQRGVSTRWGIRKEQELSSTKNPGSAIEVETWHEMADESILLDSVKERVRLEQ